METHWRSVVKGISWRAVGTVGHHLISVYFFRRTSSGRFRWADGIGHKNIFILGP